MESEFGWFEFRYTAPDGLSTFSVRSRGDATLSELRDVFRRFCLATDYTSETVAAVLCTSDDEYDKGCNTPAYVCERCFKPEGSGHTTQCINTDDRCPTCNDDPMYCPARDA